MKKYNKKIKLIQEALRDFKIDGWLFYDYEKRDPISYKVLDLNQYKLVTRRWYYFIPKEGDPIKLVHAIERGVLSELPGITMLYSSWAELHNNLAKILKESRKVAMQYSPNNNIPSISYVDAGTVELVRSFNVDVVSSANLIQMFVARLNKENILFHKKAGEKVYKIKDMAFEFIFDAVKSRKKITEYDVQQFILKEFKKEGLTSEGLNPIVAVNSHAANPHFEPTQNNTYEIKKGDRILIDLWAKIDHPSGIYYDITWCGYLGKNPPKKYAELFNTVVQARKLAKNFIVEKMEKGKRIFGWEVDDIARKYISAKGYGKYFTHRTGHSIDTKVHGSGVNLDNFETKDDRELIPGICFSIEPGIYKDDIGVRSEISVLIDYNRDVIVVGEEQENLVLMD